MIGEPEGWQISVRLRGFRKDQKKKKEEKAGPKFNKLVQEVEEYRSRLTIKGEESSQEREWANRGGRTAEGLQNVACCFEFNTTASRVYKCPARQYEIWQFPGCQEPGPKSRRRDITGFLQIRTNRDSFPNNRNPDPQNTTGSIMLPNHFTPHTICGLWIIDTDIIIGPCQYPVRCETGINRETQTCHH
jgi:hypothetical protein